MFNKRISDTLHIREWQVANVIKLLSEDATIPFIARYRKEKTGDLDEVQIRNIEEEHSRLVDLEKRRNYVLSQIEEQGKLTPELKQLIIAAMDADTLEDLYLPYKTRRKTKADIAKEAGYEPLAVAIFAQNGDGWQKNWNTLITDSAASKEVALQFARDIIAEWVSEDAPLRSKLRALFEKDALMECKVTRGKSKNEDAQKYKDYFDHKEKLSSIPSHRFLAIQRGVDEGWLKWGASPEEEQAIYQMKRHLLHGYGESQVQILLAMQDSWDRLLQPSLETEILAKAKEKADDEAIKVFAENVKQLLLAAPLGGLRILALDPGFRTGCKVVVLNETGQLLEHATIFPHEPQNDKIKSEELLQKFITKYKLDVIAIGNGTAGRESEDWLKNTALNLPVYMVNEAGASIYSASEIAREEFPDKDITVRGAVSIGRRLMDPLAELVKIDPKSIGVGQYQHDVNQGLLKKRLNSVVESAVNAVGININTASKYLLEHVSGLGPGLAGNIVKYRNENGEFHSREELKKVPRLGDKAFEQCAGFLRIRGAKNPLDNSAVHPERYKVVEKMAKDLNLSMDQLLVQRDKINQIIPEKYTNEAEGLGLPTIKDILSELQKPGLDPRGAFKAVGFSEGVRSMADLEPGMELNGIVTNIVDFGAFVDVGIKQDGLVHISNMSQKFIKHPMEVVTLGQHVKVRVMEVDSQRKRIALTMKF
ncbi:MAG: RNA-binding transcriptional accessory protein [Bacteroidia bacterium]|nr:RNA-binding transcriptional accessory protein [Bacteroidia bacterium]